VQSAVAESANAYPMGASAQALAQRRRLLKYRSSAQPAPPAPVVASDVVPRTPPSEVALPAYPGAPPVAEGTPTHRAHYELSNQVSMPAAGDTSSPGFTRLVPYDAPDGAMVSMLTSMSRQSHDLAREQGGQLLGAFAQQSKHIGQIVEQHASHLASQAAAHTSQIDMLLKLQADSHSKQMALQAETHSKQMALQAEAHSKQMEAQSKQMEAQSTQIALLTEQLGIQAKAHSELAVDALDRQHASVEAQSAHMSDILATHSQALVTLSGVHSVDSLAALGSPAPRSQRPVAYKRFSKLRPMFPAGANENSESGGDL
jgi:hypothetical protein